MPGREVRALLAAVALLTVVPVGRLVRVEGADVARGSLYFPLAGAGVGATAALAGWAAAHLVPALAAALVAAAVGAVLTGALHLDGLADTADGYGARTRERALEIMRDHATGAFGVTAIVLDVGLRAAAVAALLPRPHGPLVLVAAGALSRSTAAALGVLLPAARRDGLGGLLPGAGRWRAAGAAALGLAVAALCLGWPTLPVALALAALAALWSWHCVRRLGGMTGDTLGAASEGAEVLVLLAGAALR